MLGLVLPCMTSGVAVTACREPTPNLTPTHRGLHPPHTSPRADGKPTASVHRPGGGSCRRERSGSQDICVPETQLPTVPRTALPVGLGPGMGQVPGMHSAGGPFQAAALPPCMVALASLPAPPMGVPQGHRVHGPGRRPTHQSATFQVSSPLKCRALGGSCLITQMQPPGWRLTGF